MKAQIKTRKVYVDIHGKDHDTREQAIQSNIGIKDYFVTSRIEEQVGNILKEGNLGTSRREDDGSNYKVILSRNDVATYLINTDLLKAHKKIDSLRRVAEKAFNEEYPNVVLK